MIIYLVRHGHIEWRGKGGNPSLSQLGQLQAQHLGNWLATHQPHFTAFYSSDLTRCLQTSDFLQIALGLAYQIDPRLREAGGWSSAGQPYDLADSTSPDPPETWNDFSLRIQALWEALAEKHTSERILCVSHGGIFDVMMGQVMRFGSSPHLVTLTHHTAFSEFFYDRTVERPSRRLTLVQHNQIPHLSESLWHTA